MARFKDDMKKVKQEWENKLYYEQLEAEKRYNEMISKHKQEADNLQHDMESKFDQKITEITVRPLPHLQNENSAEIEDYKSELSHLKSIIQDYEDQIDTLKDRNDQLSDLQLQKDQELKSITEEIENELYGKIENMDLELQNLKDGNTELEQEMETKKSTISELVTKLEATEGKLKNLESKNEEILKENGMLRGRLDNDFKTKNLEDKIRENMKLAEDIQKLEGKQQGDGVDKERILAKDMDTFKELNKEMESERKDLVQSVKSLKNQIQILENKNRSLEEELEATFTKHRESRQKDIELYENEVTSHTKTKAEFNSLKQKLSSVRTQGEENLLQAQRQQKELQTGTLTLTLQNLTSLPKNSLKRPQKP